MVEKRTLSDRFHSLKPSATVEMTELARFLTTNNTRNIFGGVSCG